MLCQDAIMSPRRWLLCAAALLAAFTAFGASMPLRADDKSPVRNGKDETSEAAPDEGKGDQCAETRHHISIEGKRYNYRAAAGDMIIRTAEMKAKGRLFYVAYTVEGYRSADRPVTFAFNGGPGSSSVWLHLGALGPKRVQLGSDGSGLPPPPAYRDNPFSWLAFTDLVFVDPVGTGYSRSLPAGDQGGGQFYGVQQDIESVAEFIRLYLTRNRRWASPKYFVGESYGTTRAAALTLYVQQRYGIDVNGVVLISPVLDFHTITFRRSHDLPYVLFLPTYAAAAWHHKRLQDALQRLELQEVLRRVEAFSLDRYALLLARGECLSDGEKSSLINKLSDYTGLDASIIEEHDFRVDATIFSTHLLKDARKVIGRMDASITGVQIDPADAPGYDPSLDGLFGPFSGAMNHYVREDLEYESDLVYEFLNSEISQKWDWSSGLAHGQGFVDVTHDLREAMAINPALRVFVATGAYDLATPYFATDYTITHIRFGAQRSRVTARRYAAGHMIYTHLEAHRKLFQDVSSFYRPVRNR